MIESDWERYFGVGDPVASKVGVQAISSTGTLNIQRQITKIQPSTSAGLLLGSLGIPYTGFQHTVQLMSNSSAVINVSSSVAGGNIAAGMALVPGKVTNWLYDGTSWYPLGSSSS